MAFKERLQEAETKQQGQALLKGIGVHSKVMIKVMIVCR